MVKKNFNVCDSLKQRIFWLAACGISSFLTFPLCLAEPNSFSYLAMAYNLCWLHLTARQPASAFGSRAVWAWKFDCGYFTSLAGPRIAH